MNYQWRTLGEPTESNERSRFSTGKVRTVRARHGSYIRSMNDQLAGLELLCAIDV